MRHWPPAWPANRDKWRRWGLHGRKADLLTLRADPLAEMRPPVDGAVHRRRLAGGMRPLGEGGEEESSYSTTILPFSDQCFTPQNFLQRISYSPSELAANSNVTGRSGVAFPFSFRIGM